MIERFNIRVYGLLLNSSQDSILVCDEIRFGRAFTKFPGGGLEFGEGIGDGLKREWLEETGQEINNLQLYYVNDFLQVSAFKKEDQIISIYYRIECASIHSLVLKKTQFDFEKREEGAIIFRWTPLLPELVQQLSFPIDRIVVKKLCEPQGLTGTRT
jgi:ADP-ribose pyrophosphatase YjhB (NUDIX family)